MSQYLQWLIFDVCSIALMHMCKASNTLDGCLGIREMLRGNSESSIAKVSGLQGGTKLMFRIRKVGGEVRI